MVRWTHSLERETPNVHSPKLCTRRNRCCRRLHKESPTYPKHPWRSKSFSSFCTRSNHSLQRQQCHCTMVTQYDYKRTTLHTDTRKCCSWTSSEQIYRSKTYRRRSQPIRHFYQRRQRYFSLSPLSKLNPEIPSWQVRRKFEQSSKGGVNGQTVCPSLASLHPIG